MLRRLGSLTPRQRTNETPEERDARLEKRRSRGRKSDPVLAFGGALIDIGSPQPKEKCGNRDELLLDSPKAKILAPATPPSSVKKPRLCSSEDHLYVSSVATPTSSAKPAGACSSSHKIASSPTSSAKRHPVDSGAGVGLNLSPPPSSSKKPRLSPLNHTPRANMSPPRSSKRCLHADLQSPRACIPGAEFPLRSAAVADSCRVPVAPPASCQLPRDCSRLSVNAGVLGASTPLKPLRGVQAAGAGPILSDDDEPPEATKAKKTPRTEEPSALAKQQGSPNALNGQPLQEQASLRGSEIEDPFEYHMTPEEEENGLKTKHLFQTGLKKPKEVLETKIKEMSDSVGDLDQAAEDTHTSMGRYDEHVHHVNDQLNNLDKMLDQLAVLRTAQFGQHEGERMEAFDSITPQNENAITAGGTSSEAEALKAQLAEAQAKIATLEAEQTNGNSAVALPPPLPPAVPPALTDEDNASMAAPPLNFSSLIALAVIDAHEPTPLAVENEASKTNNDSVSTPGANGNWSRLGTEGLITKAGDLVPAPKQAEADRMWESLPSGQLRDRNPKYSRSLEREIDMKKFKASMKVSDLMDDTGKELARNAAKTTNAVVNAHKKMEEWHGVVTNNINDLDRFEGDVAQLRVSAARQLTDANNERLESLDKLVGQVGGTSDRSEKTLADNGSADDGGTEVVHDVPEHAASNFDTVSEDPWVRPGSKRGRQLAR